MEEKEHEERGENSPAIKFKKIENGINRLINVMDLP